MTIKLYNLFDFTLLRISIDSRPALGTHSTIKCDEFLFICLIATSLRIRFFFCFRGIFLDFFIEPSDE